jgi:site-specific DNA recombinase
MLIIEPNEAVIVRRIYEEFLNGYTANQIAQKLMDDGVPTYSGKTKWRARGVLDILINEKYKGDAVLQKTYKASFLSDKRVVNEGQAKQWYVENSHPAIIDRETFDKVQAEIKRRNDLAVEGEKAGGKYSRNHVFSTIIKCKCGDTFRQFSHYYKGQRIPVWVCRTHQAKKKDTCSMKPIREDRIKDAFVRALNRVIENKDEFISELMTAADTVITEKEKSDYDKAVSELNTLRVEMLELNKRNFKGKIDGIDYHDKTLEIMNKIDLLVGETQIIEKIMNEKKLARHRLDDVREFLEGSGSMSEFNDDVFRQMIEGVNMLGDEIEFEFSCGIKVMERALIKSILF